MKTLPHTKRSRLDGQPGPFAWHFLPESMQLQYGDDRRVRIGETLKHNGTSLLPCHSGLHASFRLIDALMYSSTRPILTRVRLGGEIVKGQTIDNVRGNPNTRPDKVVARARTCVWAVDSRRPLRLFATTLVADWLFSAPDWAFERGKEKKQRAAVARLLVSVLKETLLDLSNGNYLKAEPQDRTAYNNRLFTRANLPNSLAWELRDALSEDANAAARYALSWRRKASLVIAPIKLDDAAANRLLRRCVALERRLELHAEVLKLVRRLTTFQRDCYR